MNFARIRQVEKYLPTGVLTNLEISKQFPEWGVDRISEKTGIEARHIAAKEEYSSSLGVAAAQNLLSSVELDVSEFDYLIAVSQTPDFILPGIASLIHGELQMDRSAGAIDVNLGCSGYVYALGLAKGLIETGQAKNILLVTSDTYSKLLNPEDKSVRTIFGDGATATWISTGGDQDSIAGFSYGTDGSGAQHLIVPNGGMRPGDGLSSKASAAARNFSPSQFDLFMNGPEIFNFTLREVGRTLEDVLEKSNLSLDVVDYVVFHQANAFMLKHLISKLGIAPQKAPILMKDWGNTVSGTIPMALTELYQRGEVGPGARLVLLGFGVGLSWAGVSVRL